MNAPFSTLDQTNIDSPSSTTASHQPGPPTNVVPIDCTLEDLYALLGNCAALVPASEAETKAMVFTTQPVSLESTKSPAHQQSLMHRSVAVALGKESQGLCAICFTEQEAFNRFYKENPALHQTLITTGPAGWIFWVHIRGIFPPTKKLIGLIWVSDGAAIVLHPRGPAATLYQTRHSARPVQIAFSQIRWEEKDEPFFHFDLMAIQHGAPRIRKPNGRWVVNEQFWSAFLAWLMKIQYHPGQGCYYQCDRNRKTWHQQTVPSLLQKIAHSLDLLSKLPNNAYILDHRHPTKLRSLLRWMQITASTTFLGESGNELERLLSEMLEPAAGADVTSEEILTEHRRRCTTEGKIAYPAEVFFRRIAPLIDRLFHVRKCKRVVREGTMRRGFRNIRLKSVLAIQNGGVGAPDDAERRPPQNMQAPDRGDKMEIKI